MSYMKKILFIVLLPFFAFSSPMLGDQEPELIINNRILARVNDKAISVVDVMKKMDVYLARAYPEQTHSTVERYQFYNQSWRQTLNQIIDQELILADAEKLEMKISDADVRETLHARFGPNVMESLDHLGLTFSEAWHMLYSEMAVQRMSWYRVQSKGLQKIGPQVIKKAFQEHLASHPPKENWKYQVLSIRGATKQLGSIYAQKAHSLIRNESISFAEIAKQLQENSDPSIAVNVSDEYDIEGKDLSESHKAVLCSLKENSYSEPITQVSRFDQSIVHRIFYLKGHAVEKPPTFDSMVETLQDALVQKEIDDTYPVYLEKLRRKFNFDNGQIADLANGFEPFSLH